MFSINRRFFSNGQNARSPSPPPAIVIATAIHPNEVVHPHSVVTPTPSGAVVQATHAIQSNTIVHPYGGQNTERGGQIEVESGTDGESDFGNISFDIDAQGVGMSDHGDENDFENDAESTRWCLTWRSRRRQQVVDQNRMVDGMAPAGVAA